MTRYRWIAARKAEGFPVRLCCRVLEVAPSSYYDWLNVHAGGATSRELDEAYLVNEIRSIHATLDDTYGSPRLTHELRRTRCVNHKRVERIVAEHTLYATDARRRTVRTTIPDVGTADARSHPARLQRRRAGHAHLRGHHLRPHGRGMAVRGGRDRPRIATLRGLRHGRTDAHRPGQSSATHGRRHSRW